MKIVSNWEDVSLFPYSKGNKPGQLGVLRHDGSVFKISMTPELLKATDKNFLVYVQGIKEIPAKSRKAASAPAKPAPAKAASAKAAKKRKSK